MNREIKCRFWIGEQMCYPDEFGVVGENDLSGGDDFYYYMTSPDVIRMQYTGLKDKNGKEIYEGDIAILSNYVSALVIKFIDAQFNVVDVSLGEDVVPHHSECRDTNDWTVIGNIYENPELLK